MGLREGAGESGLSVSERGSCQSKLHRISVGDIWPVLQSNALRRFVSSLTKYETRPKLLVGLVFGVTVKRRIL